MSIVVIYGFTGTFQAGHEYDYVHPEPGATHKCMLFLAQPDNHPLEEVARSECSKYGFPKVDFSSHGQLKVDVLNTDQYRGFAGFYEEALRQGSALVYYPN